MPTASQHNPTTPKEHDNTSRPSALQRMLPSPISHKSKTLHPRLLRHVRNQPCEIGKARVCHQVRCLMPRHYSMQYRWSGSGRDSGCSPEVRFVITPNIYNHKVVKFDHFKIWVVQHLPRPNKLGGQACIASRVEVKKLCTEVRVGTSADVSIRALRSSGGLESP